MSSSKKRVTSGLGSNALSSSSSREPLRVVLVRHPRKPPRVQADAHAANGSGAAGLVRRAYRLGVLRLALLGLAVATVLASASVSASSTATAELRLDGVAFEPELALTPAQRSRGLMFRKKAPADGMLFVFPYESTGGFWMKNTLVPLAIAFFDARGNRVRKLSMTPCRTASCPIYDPGRRYRFALELGASDPRPARRIGPPSDLRRLLRAAR
jgi:uncharacterized protein